MTEILLGIVFVIVLLGSGMFVVALRDKTNDTIYISPAPDRPDITKLEKEVFEKADLVTKIAKETRVMKAPILAAAPEPSESNPHDTAMMRSITEKVDQIKKCAGIE